MKNKYIIITFRTVVLLTVFAVSVGCGTGAKTKEDEKERYYYHQSKWLGFDVRNIEETEQAFHDEPSIKLGYKLMNVYAQEPSIMNFEKAIYYGNRSIEIGADQSCYAIDINFLLSTIYYKLGQNQKACYFLNKALAFDKNMEIEKYKFYEREGLDRSFIESCKNKGQSCNRTNGIDIDLQDRVLTYYSLEKEGDWEKTYLYRTPLYRDSVRFDLYRQTMEKNNTGWQLLEFTVLESAIKGNYAAFRIEFVERVPEGYFPLDLHKTIKRTQVSTWEKIDGTWYCRDACSRAHLDMNVDLVMEDNQAPISIKTISGNQDNR